jgi:DNA-binding transcriptional LysR family regulator
VLESMVERELAEGRLTRVLADFCPPFPGYFLYYPSRAHLSPKLEALVSFLRFRAKKNAPRKQASRR